MALEDILETIRSESEQTVARILGEAETEAERLRQEAREEARREEQRRSGSLDDRARLERSRILSRAHLEASARRRAAREDIFQDAVGGVEQRLIALRSTPRYEAVLASLLDEALAVLPAATTARVDSADVGIIGRLLAARELLIDTEASDMPMGGVMISADGRAVDNSLESRLGRADGYLRHVAGEVMPDLRGEPG